LKHLLAACAPFVVYLMLRRRVPITPERMKASLAGA
jgi:hypothetical protein